MTHTSRPILIMAGGTGGHVFPALAIADYLRENCQRPVVWMGTRAGLEAQVVPQANIPIEWLSISGVRGKGLKALAVAPFKLLVSFIQAAGILRKHRPGAVLGMGGFVSGPGGFMSWLLRIPLIIHEQNAVRGVTNSILARFATRALYAFPQINQQHASATVVGNPVRAVIAGLADPQQRLGGRHNQPLRVLVVGGSLGAQALNETLPQALAQLDAAQRPEVWHQCGRNKLAACQKDYEAVGVNARLVEFIEDMAQAYSWADVVICRSGAMTVAELAAAGMASILVPYPYHADQQQLHNAHYLCDAQAAILCVQDQLTADFLAQKFIELSNDRQRVLEMSQKARALAFCDATEVISTQLLEVARS